MNDKLVFISTFLLLLFLIIYTLFFKIKNNNYAILILIGSFLYISISWILKRSGFFKNYNENNQCLIGENKKKEGLTQNGCLDIWHIYHFQLWLLIGLLAPGYFELVLGISVGWEILESIVFKYMGECSSKFCGRPEDIVINVIAYVIGSQISSIY